MSKDLLVAEWLNLGGLGNEFSVVHAPRDFSSPCETGIFVSSEQPIVTTVPRMARVLIDHCHHPNHLPSQTEASMMPNRPGA